MIKICCFTGHRPQYYSFKFNEKDKDCIKLKDLLRQEIIKAIKDGYNYFVAGGALGVDTWAAEIVLDLKKDYPFIKLVIAIPCLNQERRWTQESQVRYRNILDKADKIIYVSNEEYKSNLDQMNDRNRYMVDNSSMVIAVFGGAKSGTKNAVDYAISTKRKVIIINPSDFSIRKM